MQISARRLVLVAAWLLHGCGEPSTDDDTGASSASSGAATSTTEATSPGTTLDDPSSSGATTTAADSTSTPASTGPGEGSSAAGSSEGDGDTASACEPPPPAGDACLECAAANCCTAWAACQADEPCACVVDCHVVQGGSLGMCSNQCNLDSDLYQALYFCGQASCLGTCEWDCC